MSAWHNFLNDGVTNVNRKFQINVDFITLTLIYGSNNNLKTINVSHFNLDFETIIEMRLYESQVNLLVK
jgi:hypothetical protein